jgi:uncharacterized protein
MSPSKKMIIFGIVLILIALGVLFVWRTVLSRPNPPLPQNTVRIGSTTFTVEFATTVTEQTRGLSGRQSLADGTGMLFPFSRPRVQSFWMKDMNFPIDMIWIGSTTLTASGRTGIVLGFAQNAKPQPGTPLWGLKIYTSPGGVDTVLEVPAGTVTKDGIKVGEPVILNE